MIPDIFIQNNLQQLAFIGPEMTLTLAILILLGLGVIFSFRRQRLLCTLLAVAAAPLLLERLRQQAGA